MNHCIFCQIVTRQAPADIVYEDDGVIAFLPIDPVSVGHTLVVPKIHHADLLDITVESLDEVVTAARSIAIDLLGKHGATGINLLHATGKDAQQSIFHFHLHIVPRYPQDGLDLWFLG